MDETNALAVTAVRAVETADRARALWTDADRSWASRAAAEVVGEGAPPAEFLARRAELALERMRERDGGVARLAQSVRWRPRVAIAITVAALLVGLVADGVGGERRINIVYSPVLPLVLWNLVVYAILGAGFVARYGESGEPGPLRKLVAWLSGAARIRRGAGGGDPAARALQTFAADWSARAAPLYASRASRILHVAAVALALGVVAGLYLRGVAFEYRATWESTFLDASAVRAIVAAAYAPGVLLAGVSVPDVDRIAAMRAPESVNAALWLHLMAATLVIVVVVPRSLLALWAALQEHRRAARMIDDLREPYFARLLRGFHAGPAAAQLIPYSYDADRQTLASLEMLLARALGGEVALAIAPTVRYGDDTPAEPPSAAGREPLIVLFNATATPEPEVHGRFLAALRDSGGPLVVVVDEAAFNARWRDQDARREERRTLWRDAAADLGLVPVFVDLAHPDSATAEAAFDAAFEEGQA